MKISSAICLSELKQAALYFDRIIAINPSELITYSDKPLTETYLIEQYKQDRINLLQESLEEHRKLIVALAFPNGLDKNSENSFIEDLAVITRVLQVPGLKKRPQAFFNPSYVMDRFHPIQQHLAAEAYLANEQVEWISGSLGVRDIVTDFCRQIGIENAYPILPYHHESQAGNDISITLTNLKMVDIESVPFDQIIEFRSDEKSQKRFQRLRRFFERNFEGKSSEYIKDEILLCINEYELACKEHGFQTTQSILGVVIKSKVFYGTASVGIAATLAALSGIPVHELIAPVRSFAVSAGAAAVLVDIGNLALEMRKSKHGIDRLLENNSAAYLISARKALDNNL
jgi:hypothetical protein